MHQAIREALKHYWVTGIFVAKGGEKDLRALCDKHHPRRKGTLSARLEGVEARLEVERTLCADVEQNPKGGRTEPYSKRIDALRKLRRELLDQR